MTQSRTTRDDPYRSSPGELGEALAAGEVPVAVYGLGKMGLPLATVFADRTGRVVGVDTDQSVVASVNDGACHVTGEPGLPGAVADAVESGALRATAAGEEAAREAAVHVVIVPTLVDDAGSPDLSAVESVARTIASGIEDGDLVLVESTVPPGTCSNLVHPLLVEAGPVRAGEFGLAFCPERTASGSALEDIRGAYPKVVGGVDEASARAAGAVYEVVSDADVVYASDCTTAECVKIFEGVYRDVNIALANELAGLADEFSVDVLEAIEAANTQPYCDVHTPGAGVGGHCIPVYPRFLMEGCATPTPLLEAARSVNDRMPDRVVDRLREGLARRGTDVPEARVAILGVTYRPGVDEVRNSPGLSIAATLRAEGATVFAVDPVCSHMDAVPAEPARLAELPDLDLDAVVVATAHDSFSGFDWGTLESLVVVDGRQLLEEEYDHIVYTVGRGFRKPGRGERSTGDDRDKST